jgi:exopolyphosphatase/guanosine-5'-triphosphate,3'-diphosphate pyrophosphatase
MSGPGRTASSGNRTFAVIDIGSNSVRLVVFDATAHAPLTLFNEKAVCALGKGLLATRRLDPAGVQHALTSLDRYVTLARAMKVESLDLLATAAIREAEDGPAFVAEVQKRLGVRVTVLSGAEESQLAAFGLVSCLPEADGLMGDLGGGSLDLVTIDQGRCGKDASLPLGLLWLAEAGGNDIQKARRIVESTIGRLDWIGEVGKRAFFPVGGSWRALAGVAIDQSAHALRVLDNFTMSAADCASLCRLIAGLGPKSLEKMPGVSRRRLHALPLAAVILDVILQLGRPERVVFSAYGMREGQFFKRLRPPPGTDPMLSACAALGQRSPRFSPIGDQVAKWIEPLFGTDSGRRVRLRTAAAHLSDIAWTEHPDIRAHLAFERIIHMPIPGLTHADRGLLAAIVAFRYSQALPAGRPFATLVSEADMLWARQVGASIRLAFTLSGGVAAHLRPVVIAMAEKTVDLIVPGRDAVYAGDTVERRLGTLARLFDRGARVLTST